MLEHLGYYGSMTLVTLESIANFLNDNGGVISALTLVVVLATPLVLWLKNKTKKITMSLLKPTSFQWEIDSNSNDGVPRYIRLFVGIEAKSEKQNNEGTIQRLFISSGNHETISPSIYPVAPIIRPFDGGTPVDVPINFTVANPQLFYYQFNSEQISMSSTDFVSKVLSMPTITIKVGYRWKTASMKKYKESFLDIDVPTESLKVSLRIYFNQIGRSDLSNLI